MANRSRRRHLSR